MNDMKAWLVEDVNEEQVAIVFERQEIKRNI